MCVSVSEYICGRQCVSVCICGCHVCTCVHMCVCACLRDFVCVCALLSDAVFVFGLRLMVMRRVCTSLC